MMIQQKYQKIKKYKKEILMMKIIDKIFKKKKIISANIGGIFIYTMLYNLLKTKNMIWRTQKYAGQY